MVDKYMSAGAGHNGHAGHGKQLGRTWLDGASVGTDCWS